MATGHYATIVNDLTQKESGRPFPRIEKAADTAKDQSYFLARLSRKQLARILCPLAGITKDQVKVLAAEHHLVPVTGKESQDICFIHDRNLADFSLNESEQYPGPDPSSIVTAGRWEPTPGSMRLPWGSAGASTARRPNPIM